MRRIVRSSFSCSSRTLRAILLPVLAYVALPLPAAPQSTPAAIGEIARPERLRYVQHFPLGVSSAGSYSVPVTIPKFGPAQGTLLSVDVRLTGNGFKSIAWENLSQFSATGTMDFACDFRFTGPGVISSTVLGPFAPVRQTDVRSFAPFDGVIDGVGASGVTFAYSLSTTQALHVDTFPQLYAYQSSTGSTSYGLSLQPSWSYQGTALYSAGTQGILGSVFLTPTTVSARLEIVYTYQ